MSAIFSLSPFVDILIFFTLFSSWATYKIVKRSQTKNGCLSLGYIWLVIFIVGILSSGLFMMLIQSTYNNTQAIVFGKSYTATITDYSSYQSTDDEGNRRTYHSPIFSFTTDEGQSITKKAGYGSTALPEIGKEQTVFYNAQTGHLFIWGYIFVVMLVGLFLMGSVLFLILYGIARYASGYDMESYWQLIMTFLIKYFVPIAMISFDALLIYALFQKDQPIFVTIILGFFITVLTLAIPGYFKAIKPNNVSKKVTTFKRKKR